MWIMKFALKLSFSALVISPDQRCSVPDRSIFGNLNLLRDLVDYVKQTNETGILVNLDQEKAFDRVDRDFLMRFTTTWVWRNISEMD